MVSVSFKYPVSLALVALIGILSVAKAQWQNVGPQVFLSPDPQKGCAISYADGVVWAGGHSLWRSDDLGLTWSQSSTFPLGSMSDTICGIYFFDRMNGCVLANSHTFMTTDGGTSWNKLSMFSSRWGAYGSTADTFYLRSYGFIDVIVKGVSAQQIFGTLGISPVAYGHHKAYYLDDGRVRMSQDGGSKWIAGTSSDVDCNGFAIDSCSNGTIYLVNEEIFVPTDLATGVFVSHDDGKTWSMKNRHGQYYYAGDLATSSYAVYTQTQDGIIRSTDEGETWTSIGGPTGPPDNLSLAVAADSILLAIDSFGVMWRTFNDGGDPVVRYHEPPLLLTNSLMFSRDTLAPCDSLLTRSALSSAPCHCPRFSKAEISGTDNGAYNVSRFTQNDIDSFVLTFHPTKAGKHDATLLLIYGTDTLTIDLAAVGTASNPALFQSTDSLFQTAVISTCDSSLADRVRIHVGCPLRHIVRSTISGPDAADYQVTSVGHDSILYVDSLDITCTPSANGKTDATLTVTYDDGSSATIALAGTGQATAPVLAKANDTLFEWARLYQCEQPVNDSTLALAYCSKRTVVSTTLSGADAQNYAVLRTARDGTIDCDSFYLSFHPSSPGTSQALLTITYDDGSTLQVPLRGAGLENPKASVRAYDVHLKDTIGAVVRIPIIVTHDKALAAVEFRLTFDTSLLIFNRFAFANDSLISSSQQSAFGVEDVHFPVKSDTTADTIYAYFYWFPTYDSITHVDIASIKAISVGDGCLVDINPTTQSTIVGPVQCVTAMLSNFVRYGQSPYLNIEPNPASQTIRIRSSLTDGSTIIFDALGREVYQSGTSSSGISISDLPSGLYYVEIRSGSHHITKPLMVAH